MEEAKTLTEVGKNIQEVQAKHPRTYKKKKKIYRKNESDFKGLAFQVCKSVILY